MITRRNRKGRLVSFDENALVPLKSVGYQKQSVLNEGRIVFHETLVHFTFWGHEKLVFTQPVGYN